MTADTYVSPLDEIEANNPGALRAHKIQSLFSSLLMANEKFLNVIDGYLSDKGMKDIPQEIVMARLDLWIERMSLDHQLRELLREHDAD